MDHPTKQPSNLRKLVNILTAAVDVIDDRYAAADLDFPALDEPYNAGSAAEQLLTSDPSVTHALGNIVAACGQLAACVEFPTLAILNAGMYCHISSSLYMASTTNIAEILREAGPSGLHVEEIAKKTGTHPTKTGRILRLLATNHIFREVSPNVFANNRLSSTLDTTKSTAELFTKPHEKHVGTSGIAAFVEHTGAGALKGSARLVDALTDPKFGHSEEHTKTPFNLALGTELAYFDWLEVPENSFQLDTFSSAMDGSRKLEVPDAILKGFDWSSLAKDSTVVDVGGGIGSSSLSIARNNPELNIVLQDFPSVVDNARQHWKTELPNAVASGRIKFQGHDFFLPQPVKSASIFLLRGIIHDWSDTDAKIILKHLRDAAAPATQLLIVDQVLRYACADTTPSLAIPGAARPSPPHPLLPNYGKTTNTTYLIDLQMLALLNGRERTLPEVITLADATGWKITRVFHIPGSPVSQIVAQPS